MVAPLLLKTGLNKKVQLGPILMFWFYTTQVQRQELDWFGSPAKITESI